MVGIPRDGSNRRISTYENLNMITDSQNHGTTTISTVVIIKYYYAGVHLYVSSRGVIIPREYH